MGNWSHSDLYLNSDFYEVCLGPEVERQIKVRTTREIIHNEQSSHSTVTLLSRRQN